MAFVTIEDIYGSIEVIIFPKLFAKYSNILHTSNVLFVGGRLSVREEENPKIILDFADTAENAKSNQSKRKGLFIRVENETSAIYFNCNELISLSNQGETPVYFYFANSKKYFPCKKITIENNLINKLKEIAGEQNVILQI